MKKVTAFAPATVANVSCGFDILGFAIDELGDQVTVMRSDSPGLKVTAISGDGGKLPYEAERNTCSVAIQAMLDQLGIAQGMEIILEKGLPLGSGMGSSAASAAAALVAANALLNEPFTKKELVPFAMEAERVACGAAHADNVAPSILGGFVLIRDYQPLDLVKLPVPAGLHCTLLHPHLELNTSDSRSVLRKQISLKDSTIQSGNIAGLISGLFLSDFQLISRSLRDVVAEPSRALLIPGFYELRENIKAIGALGSGISGSGPTIFVLSPDKEIAIMAGKVSEDVFGKIGLGLDVYISEINNNGAYLKEEKI
ncbi:Homoserine kinase [Indibacter alkaliphilus LW1]|jgi:homoserine kinase|uniref:Homoserine kinase n=1 Tax=Indibacter alkaliphilus (strain CCUG 57479 / KCTC 22604 / LW1) TaxID=1189612 RepID=S2D5P7_INDAL|nr:homoserine kinase [Indibacter alkaliphilus]EOZ92400.1 Homoserine kinase [Indibacter alkaliphilus LW1]